MPATAFDPTAALVVHSAVPLDSAVLELLKEEQFLLVQRCVVRPTVEKLSETDAAGNLIFYASFNFQLRYSVTARVLQMGGLAQYHPGMALSAEGLEFINGEQRYFGFPPLTLPARLVYEDPALDLAGGDLPGLTFDVVRMFDTAEPEIEEDPDIPDNPGGGGGGGYNFAAFGYHLYWIRTIRIEARGQQMTGGGYLSLWQAIPDTETLPGSVDMTYFEANIDTQPEPEEIEAEEGWRNYNIITAVFDARPADGLVLSQSGAYVNVKNSLRTRPGPPPGPREFDGGDVAWWTEPGGYGTHLALRWVPADVVGGVVIAPAYYYTTAETGEWTTLAEFLADNTINPGWGIGALYDLRHARWLTGAGPEDEMYIEPIPPDP